MFSIQRVGQGERDSFYRLQGEFGPEQAWQLVKQLRAEPDRSRVAIDLERVSKRSRLALYVLAHDLPIQERHGRRLTLLGLRGRERRFLRYLCAEGLIAQG